MLRTQAKAVSLGQSRTQRGLAGETDLALPKLAGRWLVRSESVKVRGDLARDPGT
jgi:hypothetical protein